MVFYGELEYPWVEDKFYFFYSLLLLFYFYNLFLFGPAFYDFVFWQEFERQIGIWKIWSNLSGI